jgi:hypothetical protein
MKPLKLFQIIFLLLIILVCISAYAEFINSDYKYPIERVSTFASSQNGAYFIRSLNADELDILFKSFSDIDEISFVKFLNSLSKDEMKNLAKGIKNGKVPKIEEVKKNSGNRIANNVEKDLANKGTLELTKYGIDVNKLNLVGIATKEEFLENIGRISNVNGFNELMNRITKSPTQQGAIFEVKTAGLLEKQNMLAEVSHDLGNNAGELDMILTNNNIYQCKFGWTKTAKTDTKSWQTITTTISKQKKYSDKFLNDNSLKGEVYFIFDNLPGNDLNNWLNKNNIKFKIITGDVIK